MENNAIINSRLKDLLDVMDARIHINIFIYEGAGQKCIMAAEVYKILCMPSFMDKYKNFEVVGLNLGLVTNILIEEVKRL